MNAHTSIVAAEAVPTIRAARAELAEALKYLCTVIERRNTIPILSGVLFEPEGSGDETAFRLVGTDLDMEAAITPAALFTAPRPFVAANAQALYDVLRASKAEHVTLELIGDGLRVSMDGGAISLATLPADDFPRVKSSDAVASFTLPGADFAADLMRIQPAISTEETRYYLNGLFIHPTMSAPVPMGEEESAMRDEIRELVTQRRAGQAAEAEGAEGQLSPDDVESIAARIAELKEAAEALEAARRMPDTLALAATDGHRMAVQHRPLPEGAETCPASIIPRKLIAGIRALMGKKAAPDVALAISPSTVRVRIGPWSILSKLIDGSFPDYQRVIPSQNDVLMGITGARLAECTKRATAVSKERTRTVRLSIDPVEGGGHASFTVSSPESGVGQAETACAFSSADAFEIGFNAAYLEKMGDIFGDAVISIAMADCRAPALFTSESVPGFKAVLMPMRTDGGTVAPAAQAAPAAEPAESPYHRFHRVYRPAWNNRDKAGMARAVADYRGAMKCDAAMAHATIAYEAAEARRVEATSPAYAGDQLAKSRRAEARIRMMRLAENGFVSRNIIGGGTHSAGTFARLNEACQAIASLADLSGYDRADPRNVLPVTLCDGSSTFVAAHELADIARPCMSRRDAKGTATRKRSESNIIWRHHIVAVQAPKLSASEQAGKVISIERENGHLRDRLAALESLVNDLLAVAVTPAPAPAVEIPAPMPVSEPVAAVEALEAVEGGPGVAELVEAVQPSVMGTIIADLAARLEAAEAKLARYERARPVTAGRMRWLRASERVACRQVEEARAEARNAQADATDAEERANGMAGRLHVAETELARLAPLAAAIAGLVQPVQAPPFPHAPMALPADMVAA